MPSPDLFPRVLLWTIGGGFLVGYALPLLFAPLRWARLLRWHLPEGNPALTVYFARCLGSIALVITLLSLRAAGDPRRHVEVVELLLATGAVMTGVHVWGAVERSQPPAETAEIALYAVLTLALWMARTALV